MQVRFFILFIGLAIGPLNAQQWMQFSQSERYHGYVNPSLAGLDNEIDAVVAHRSQYVGLSERAIASQFVGFQMPLINKQFGVGVSLVNDLIGYQRYTLGMANAAYHLNFGKSTLSLGLGLGAVQMKLDGNKLRAAGGTYANQQVIHNDEALPGVSVGSTSFTMSSGVQFSLQNWQLGLAIQNINSPKLEFSTTGSGTFTRITRTINLHSSYVIKVGSIEMQPTFFYKTDLLKHQMQLDFLVAFKNIMVGAAFRGYSGYNNDAVIGHIGFKIKEKFNVQYSYDFNVSALQQANSGSHEISLRFLTTKNFKEKSQGNIMYTPRFL